MHTHVALGALVLASGLTLAPSKPNGTTPKKLPEPPLHWVAQEVRALRTLYHLRATAEQMKVWLVLSKETSAGEREVKKAVASDDYRSLLTDQKKALADASDPDRIAELDEKVTDLHDSESPEIDETFDIPVAARKRVAEVIKQLKPSQVAGFYMFEGEEVLDPLDELTAGLESIRESKAEDWKGNRDAWADDLAWLVGGLDDAKYDRVHEGIVELLTKARELTEDEFGKQKGKLDKQAVKVIGPLDPTVVLRHFLEREIAELLANPRLEAALKMRLESEK